MHGWVHDFAVKMRLKLLQYSMHELQTLIYNTVLLMLHLEMQDAEAGAQLCEMKWTLREMPPWDANAERAEQLSHDNFPPKWRRIIKASSCCSLIASRWSLFYKRMGRIKILCVRICVVTRSPRRPRLTFTKTLNIYWAQCWALGLSGQKPCVEKRIPCRRVNGK